jgi:hypothetical protein
MAPRAPANAHGVPGSFSQTFTSSICTVPACPNEEDQLRFLAGAGAFGFTWITPGKTSYRPLCS